MAGARRIVWVVVALVALVAVGCAPASRGGGRGGAGGGAGGAGGAGGGNAVAGSPGDVDDGQPGGDNGDNGGPGEPDNQNPDDPDDPDDRGGGPDSNGDPEPDDDREIDPGFDPDADPEPEVEPDPEPEGEPDPAPEPDPDPDPDPDPEPDDVDPDPDPEPDPAPDPEPEPALADVPEFGFDRERRLTVVANEGDGIDVPKDLDWRPDRDNELWIANWGYDGMVILLDAGERNQRTLQRADVYRGHFMHNVSSLAMGDNEALATSQESRNEGDNSNDFMGPALWPSDYDIFGVVNQGPPSQLGGSHLDMLHQSPLSMGIAHDAGNAYWVFDGLNGHVVYYDFQDDHGPGHDDHSDGIVRRYPEASLTRVAEVPGHLEKDHSTGWLYMADTGRGRIIRLDTDSGRIGRQLFSQTERLEEFVSMTGVDVETVVDRGLEAPSGLALKDRRIFVSDNDTGVIHAFDYDGEEIGTLDTGSRSIMGLSFGPDGKLWYVDAGANEVVRIDP